MCRAFAHHTSVVPHGVCGTAVLTCRCSCSAASHVQRVCSFYCCACISVHLTFWQTPARVGGPAAGSPALHCLEPLLLAAPASEPTDTYTDTDTGTDTYICTHIHIRTHTQSLYTRIHIHVRSFAALHHESHYISNRGYDKFGADQARVERLYSYWTTSQHRGDVHLPHNCLLLMVKGVMGDRGSI